eukprot:scaffold205209_cov14-Tisochrysis_lutea.AAC.1
MAMRTSAFGRHAVTCCTGTETCDSIEEANEVCISGGRGGQALIRTHVEDVCLPGLGSVEGKGGLEEAKVEGKGEGSL